MYDAFCELANHQIRHRPLTKWAVSLGIVKSIYSENFQEFYRNRVVGRTFGGAKVLTSMNT